MWPFLSEKNVSFTPKNTITDANGRYIIVTGTLFLKPVILVAVYAPNWDDQNFMKQLLSSIPDLDSHLLLLGGT